VKEGRRGVAREGEDCPNSLPKHYIQGFLFSVSYSVTPDWGSVHNLRNYDTLNRRNSSPDAQSPGGTSESP